MAKILTIEEMLNALREVDADAFARHVGVLEAAATDLAKALAAATGTVTNYADLQDGMIAAPFFAASADQECPMPIASYDEGGDWEPMSAGKAPACGA